MAKDEKSEMREIAKRVLQGRGYVVRLSTSREGDSMIGKIQVTDAATDRAVATLVSVGKIDNLEIVFGLDATEGIAREFLSQAMGLADLFKFLIPGMSIKEE
ncbi:MAG: hypothetical protein A3K66_01680 [Euryarchaeota archaeon RBG_16_67_27]|nr:MAG: hypothetical protein A3K66_01680 [Euryarchaeota archaeon RBG_16_67_27]